MWPPDRHGSIVSINKSRVIHLAAFVAIALPMNIGLSTLVLADVQIADITDTLDNAVKGPRLINGSTDPYFDIFAADREQFDSNVFRLASSTDVLQTVGPAASRQDHINSPSAGLDGQWSLGRQIFLCRPKSPTTAMRKIPI